MIADNASDTDLTSDALCSNSFGIAALTLDMMFFTSASTVSDLSLFDAMMSLYRVMLSSSIFM